MSHNSAFGKRSTHSVRRNGLKVLAAALAVAGLTALATADAASATASSGGPPGPASRSQASRSQASRGQASRGQLVSATPLRTLPTAAAVRAELTGDGFDASAVRYGVRSFRLVYRTVDSRGRPTTASGLMVLPASGARQLTVVSYTHGTEIYRGDAPSMQPAGFGPAPAYTFAA